MSIHKDVEGLYDLLVLAVMLVVQLLSPLLGLVLGTLTVDVVGALRLGELVDLTASNAGKELLGERMVDGLACMPLSGPRSGLLRSGL